ncbi:L,D-transpeptidase [Ahrensia sp. R2A130]|uniref:L,D-transpeptidase n=1 Tax=Ahrensia sp. R2A130 TaxID=744979 RepID=UPI0001E08BFB|nr:L,D-transpeptidase [Ahrensia sp. R2A130]EFL89963.1 ErfK/YbiS/YcfS/YnhG family protein [Ahrensia sp. R2A130]
MVSTRILLSGSALLSLVVLQGCTGVPTTTAGYAALTGPASVSRLSETEQGIYQSRKIRSQVQKSVTFDYALEYSGRQDGEVFVEAFDYTKMNKRYLRQEVAYFGAERPGTILVDARRKFLYLIQPNKTAIRYGIAVGKEGYGWTGNSILQWKQKWPTWTPPKEMIERKPELAKYAEGLGGGSDNPLGARAMYLFKNGKDTLYRIHGTNKPYSIGKAASSGCFRMINQDVIDLYSRVGNKVQVQVRPEVKQAALSASDQAGR